jgi:hypothetical protein
MSLADVYIKNSNPNEPDMNKTYTFTNSIEETAEKSIMHTEMKESGKVVLKWDEGGTIAPGRAVHCQSWAIKGTYDSDYTAVVEVITVDDRKFLLEQPGHFKSIGWSMAASDCLNIPLSDVPESRVGHTKVVEAGEEGEE